MPAITLCSSSQSFVFLAPRSSCDINSSHGSPAHCPSSSAIAAVCSACSQKPMLGVLSTAPSFSNGLHLRRVHRTDEQGVSSSCSTSSFSMKSLHDSSKGGHNILSVSSSRSTSSIRTFGDRNSRRTGREGQFNGLIRSALDSCLDHSSSLPRIGSDGRLPSDEATLNFGDTTEELGSRCEPEARKLLSEAQAKHMVFNDNFIVKAFYEAEKAHRGQARLSGDPYLQHCVGTAELLADIGANTTVIAAGLLHDTVDDSFMTFEYIFREFGDGVADLVEGVSKISRLSKLARENSIALRTVEADRFHTIILAMTDARAVLIKLADRLHNMMTLQALEKDKQQRIANETLVIFAPLAHRLGILSWKEKLESLCFEHLHPEEHKSLESKLLKYFDKAMVASAIKKLEQALKSKEVSYHVLTGRHKSLYSIYCKMLRNNQSMDQIHDIHGLRLIVENEKDCYKALEVIHCLWMQVPGRFKDYIQHPKINGYQSLHSVVLSEEMLSLEVQIRTREMHLQAELGFAAHWRYKGGDYQHTSFVLHLVEGARWALSCHCKPTDANYSAFYGTEGSMPSACMSPLDVHTCPYEHNHQTNDDGPVYIISLENDKMFVREFPANSTVMDLLEKLGGGSYQWHAYGFTVKEELRPRLNGEPISNPSQKLKMGDVVELSPTIPDESLMECREEIKRMYDREPSASKQNSFRS